MELKVLSADERHAKVLLSGASPAYANALRRAMIAEVPTLAIEDVIIYENTSPLYDEILAHRLGLVPIRTDLSRLNLREECSCGGEGCPSCTLTLSLEAEGEGMVYSHDLRSPDPELTPLPGIPIVRLREGQRLKLEAEAVLGRGREHAKWQAAVAGYKYYPEIEVLESCTGCGDCVEACPKGIMKLEDGRAVAVNQEACILCRACVQECEENAVQLRASDEKFIFTIESTGALPPLEVLRQACRCISKKAERMIALL